MNKYLILVIFLFSSPGYSKKVDIYKSWSELLGGFSNVLDGVTNSQTLTQFLFNTFSDIGAPVYSFHAPQIPIADIGFGIDVGGGRKVIYNGTIDNSYTVIDKFLVGIRPEAVGMYSGVKFGIRTKLNFFVTDVRQVGARDYDILDPLDKKVEDLKEKFRIEKNRKYTPKEVELDNETYSNFYPSNKEKIERKATFGRIWNPLTMTFRLPLTPNAANRMGDNEILSYTLSGGVEFAAGFGASLDPAGLILRTGVDASVYFKGIYEIVVLKEKPEKAGENFVRVKIG